jgi:hypothetical protein
MTPENNILKEGFTHGTHGEDEVLKGPAGFKRLLNFFKQTINLLEGHKSKNTPLPTSKFDGSPALVFFSDFDGLPGAGVSTKSIFNANPKIYYSEPDIDKDNRPGELKKKLKIALKLVKSGMQIPNNQIWQGDLLWTEGDAKSIKDGDEEYIFVKPNTLMYAAPSNSDLANSMLNKKIGIVFHTRYYSENGSLENVKQSNDININELQNVPDWAFVIDAQIRDASGKVSWNKNESDIIWKLYDTLSNIYDELAVNIPYKRLCNNEEFINFYVMTLQNYKVDNKEDIDPNKFIDDLHKWITKKTYKKYQGLSNLKTKSGRDKKRPGIQSVSSELHSLVENNEETLYLMAEALSIATELKYEIMNKMNQASNFITMIEKRNGTYEKTAGEGFVISDIHGNFIKLVDRKSFSYYNRSPDVVKGFEHPENLQESQGEKEEIILEFNTEQEAEIAVNDINEEAKRRELFESLLQEQDNAPEGKSNYLKTKTAAEELLQKMKSRYKISGQDWSVEKDGDKKWYVKVETVKDQSTGKIKVKASRPASKNLKSNEKEFARPSEVKSKSNLDSILNKMPFPIFYKNTGDEIKALKAPVISIQKAEGLRTTGFNEEEFRNIAKEFNAQVTTVVGGKCRFTVPCDLPDIGIENIVFIQTAGKPGTSDSLLEVLRPQQTDESITTNLTYVQETIIAYLLERRLAGDAITFNDITYDDSKKICSQTLSEKLFNDFQSSWRKAINSMTDSSVIAELHDIYNFKKGAKTISFTNSLVIHPNRNPLYYGLNIKTDKPKQHSKNSVIQYIVDSQFGKDDDDDAERDSINPSDCILLPPNSSISASNLRRLTNSTEYKNEWNNLLNEGKIVGISLKKAESAHIRAVSHGSPNLNPNYVLAFRCGEVHPKDFTIKEISETKTFGTGAVTRLYIDKNHIHSAKSFIELNFRSSGNTPGFTISLFDSLAQGGRGSDSLKTMIKYDDKTIKEYLNRINPASIERKFQNLVSGLQKKYRDSGNTANAREKIIEKYEYNSQTKSSDKIAKILAMELKYQELINTSNSNYADTLERVYKYFYTRKGNGERNFYYNLTRFVSFASRYPLLYIGNKKNIDEDQSVYYLKISGKKEVNEKETDINILNPKIFEQIYKLSKISSHLLG